MAINALSADLTTDEAMLMAINSLSAGRCKGEAK